MTLNGRLQLIEKRVIVGKVTSQNVKTNPDGTLDFGEIEEVQAFGNAPGHYIIVWPFGKDADQWRAPSPDAYFSLNEEAKVKGWHVNWIFAHSNPAAAERLEMAHMSKQEIHDSLKTIALDIVEPAARLADFLTHVDAAGLETAVIADAYFKMQPQTEHDIVLMWLWLAVLNGQLLSAIKAWAGLGIFNNLTSYQASLYQERCANE